MVVFQQTEENGLRNRICNLEDQLNAAERNDRNREEEFSRNRRLVKLVEKYKVELDEAHGEIRDLKTRLVHCAEQQVPVIV